MHRFLILAGIMLAGCNTINVTVSGSNNRISIEQPKTIGVSPSVEASGNTVPITP